MSAAAIWNVPPPTYDAHSSTTAYVTTSLTPYLTLPHLLSLTWLAAPILSLIFVAFRLQLSLADAQSAVARAKVNLLASCAAAEEAATSAASMPRYMALATNKQFADALNGSMQAARAALVLSLTAMEGVINFIVDLYRSTLLCFLELIVRGGLALLIGAVQEINQVVQSVASGLRSSIQSDISSANSVIQSAVDAINRVNPFSKITAPQIAVPSLDALQNVTLPPTLQDSLVKLNASIPSVADIKQKVEAVIDTPFELLKKDINDTFAAISFQPEGLPIPDQNRLKFCDSLDTSIVDDVGRDLIKTAKIGVVLLIILALILVGLNCLLTWYKWRCMKSHLEYTRQAWMTDPTLVHPKSSISAPQVTLSDHNLLMLHADSEHPLITRIVNQMSARLHLTPRQHTHTRWFLNYIFHGPALACFLIGFFGLLSVEIQLLAMGPLVAKYQARAHSTVSNFNQLIATSINSSMYNQSAFYAREVNGKVDAVQSKINGGVFGWVNGTTTTLNNTINEFYADVQNAVAQVFNGTILQTPAQDFIKCFIGGKVDAIENALTFLHDNLRVDMPRVNETVLILSPQSVDEATRPIAAAAIGGGSNDNEGLVGSLIQSYAASLKKERVMFLVFMALWGVVFFMGLCVLLWHSYGKSYIEKRKKRKYEQEQRSGFDSYSSHIEKGKSVTELRAIGPSSDKKRASFKPFWLSAKSSPGNESASSSQETIAFDSPWETSFSQSNLQPIRRQKTRTSKLLAAGRKAFVKEPRLKKDNENAEENQAPLENKGPESLDRRDDAWYNKVTALLTKKKNDDDGDDLSNSKPASNEQEQETTQQKPKPKLHVYTARAIAKHGPLPRQSQSIKEEEAATRSRFSTSPAAVQTSWKKVISPPRKLMSLQPPMVPTSKVVATQEPETPSPPRSFNQISPPMRKPKQPTPDIPLDVGTSYDDPFLNPGPEPIFPVPLHSGFDSQPSQLTFTSRRDQCSSLPQTPLTPSPSLHAMAQYSRYPVPYRTPKSPDRHRKSFSLGGQALTPTSQWRVTNAVPSDFAYDSTSSSFVSSFKKEETKDVYSSLTTKDFLSAPPPVPRILTAAHTRRGSSVNPFITPFDDEHQVRIDEPSPAGLRKSMRTDPVAMAY